MMPRLVFSTRLTWQATLLMALFVLAACGGGGGSGPSPEDNVTIRGFMDDGSGDTPIPDAVCRFLVPSGAQAHSDTTDANGAFRLVVAPDTRGHIVCSPRTAPSLALSTFCSTLGSATGSDIDSERVTPATTVVSDIIDQEAGPDPEGRKVELLNDIATHSDPDLDIVVTMAERLYQAMYARQIDTGFGDDDSGNGGDGGDGGNGDSGGASGDVGDGADFSPLKQATCDFVVGPTLAGGEPVSRSALADFIADGLVDRPDLAAVAEEVNQGTDPTAVQSAFHEIFPNGLGSPIETLSDDQGHYNLPVPPNMSGYIRCIPEGFQRLVLGTYFRARDVDESVDGQDVNPAITMFSTEVVPNIRLELDDALLNFWSDIDGLEVNLSGPNLPLGPVTGMTLASDSLPANVEVNLVASAVTSMFNAFYKNNYDVDFLAAITELRENHTVRPAFLEAQGIPVDESQGVANLIDEAIAEAALSLGTDLETAWSTGRINVTVMDDEDGRLISDATLEITNTEPELTCSGCGSQTDTQGQLTLVIGGVGQTPTEIVVAVSDVPGFAPATFSTQLVALATIDLEARLTNTAWDTLAPTVTITSPSGVATITSSGILDIQGTATDNDAVVSVTWSNDRGGSGTCQGTTDWSASGITLSIGVNLITITARDAAGNESVDELNVTYVQPEI